MTENYQLSERQANFGLDAEKLIKDYGYSDNEAVLFLHGIFPEHGDKDVLTMGCNASTFMLGRTLVAAMRDDRDFMLTVMNSVINLFIEEPRESVIMLNSTIKALNHINSEESKRSLRNIKSLANEI